jgi:hypothetical protein
MEDEFSYHRSLREAVASPSGKCTRGRPSCTRRSLLRVQHSVKSARGIYLRLRAKNHAFGKGFPKVILALGEELTSWVAAGAVSLFKKNLPRVQHSGKTPSSSSVAAQALGKDTLFPERYSPSTRGRHPLPREPLPGHSRKTSSFPRAAAQALEEDTFFPESRSPCTRRSHFDFFCFSM